MRRSSAFRLLTAHYALFQLATALAGGFVGAYLLKMGVGLPLALVSYAGLLALRFSLRFGSLALVRRLGYRRALACGTALSAAQLVPLMHANSIGGLMAWVLVTSMAESLYWPVYHAAAAVISSQEHRGREVGLRTAVSSVVSVIGPLIGGLLLHTFGAGVDFTLAGGLTLASIIPLLAITAIPAGPVPAMRATFAQVDRGATAAFAADGWMASGLALAWPMVLFLSLGSQFDSFGIMTAGAGAVGVATAVLCGRSIDRGGRDRYLMAVCGALLLGFAMRSVATWSPLAASVASATGAAVNGVYVPILMSVIYDRAKQSGAAYRFHFAAEAGWDCGAALGCVAAALVAGLTSIPSLAVLPAAFGVLPFYWLVRRRPLLLPGDSADEVNATETSAGSTA